MCVDKRLVSAEHIVNNRHTRVAGRTSPQEYFTLTLDVLARKPPYKLDPSTSDVSQRGMVWRPPDNVGLRLQLASTGVDDIASGRGQ